MNTTQRTLAALAALTTLSAACTADHPGGSPMTTSPSTTAATSAQLVDVNGTTLHVERRGAGAPVLLIHGGGEDASMLAGQAASLADAGYEVATYDRRGTGRSGREDWPGARRPSARRRRCGADRRAGLDRRHRRRRQLRRRRRRRPAGSRPPRRRPRRGVGAPRRRRRARRPPRSVPPSWRRSTRTSPIILATSSAHKRSCCRPCSGSPCPPTIRRSRPLGRTPNRSSRRAGHHHHRSRPSGTRRHRPDGRHGVGTQ